MLKIVGIASILLAIASLPTSDGACSIDDKGVIKCDDYKQFEETPTYSWASDCDFPGYDIRSVADPKNTCGNVCFSTERCTYFTWEGGICKLKHNPVEVLEEPVSKPGRICGYIQTRTGSVRVGK